MAGALKEREKGEAPFPLGDGDRSLQLRSRGDSIGLRRGEKSFGIHQSSAHLKSREQRSREHF